jgi:PIN domain nuclease of toxin-antitoxin system
MRLLFDTHLLLWATRSDDTAADLLPREAARLIDDGSNELVFSVASIWEIMIKHGLGRADFRNSPHVIRRSALDAGWSELQITSEHALGVGNLPALHKDPFDRILIAQATAEGITLLTSDPVMASYPGPIRRI